MLQNAVSASSPAVAQEIGDRKDALDAARTTLAGSWVTTKTKPARDRANAHAEKDFSVAEGALNTFLYRLNAYSIAPVAVFDVAQVWPSGVGTRFAVGGGVRMSLVNVNFTVGYAANPRRSPGEGPGAFFFQLDVSNLFH